MANKISIKYYLEYIGYTAVEKFVLCIPDSSFPSIARFFAFLMFYIFRIRRAVSIQNLRIAFPTKSSEWHKKIAYFSYLHFAMMIMEYMKMNKWSPERLATKFLQVNMEDLLNSMNSNKGVVIVSGHFGNWEMGIGYLFLHGIRSSVIQQKQRNSLVDEKMKKPREKWGIEIIDPSGAVNASIVALKKGRLIALLGDQDAGDRGAIVTFFGKQSSTHVGAAIIHLKSGASLFFAECTRVNTSCFDFKIIKIADCLVKRFHYQDVKEVTGLFTKYLEKAVQKKPEQYFWMHRRWKTTISL